MAKFLTGDELNFELGKIIEQAEEELIIICPFIKLHERTKEKLKDKLNEDGLEIIIVFGKNEEDIHKSISKEDINFLKGFPNIEIRYERRLHAKYYANENSAIMTSMNLYDASINNNIEFGIQTRVDKAKDDALDVSAYDYFEGVIDKSEIYFKKEPKYKNGWLGLSNEYLSSEVQVDKFDSTFKQTSEFIDVRKSSIPGYCIRTGQKIRFNPKKPFTLDGYKAWTTEKNPNSREKYCHFSGELSNGETTFSRPIMTKNWTKAKSVHNF